MSAVTYRLPDWMGGQPAQVVTRLIPEEWGSHVTVRIVGAPDSSDMEIPAHWLVAIKPPSIDDPEPLPVKLDALTLDAWLPGAAKTVARISIEGMTTTVWQGLEVPDLRRLARAMWQRANAVEAGERS